jgi:hypothetical protein
METRDIEWQWVEADLGGCAEYGENRFIFTFNESEGMGEVRRVGPTGDSTRVWSLACMTADSAALVVHDDILYVALYLRSATGCRVLAVDLASRERLWETRLKGLGSIGHSKYSNRVQMRMIGQWLVVFGREASGDYIEVLDPRNGQLISSERV